jgi:hypothetical protein
MNSKNIRKQREYVTRVLRAASKSIVTGLAAHALLCYLILDQATSEATLQRSKFLKVASSSLEEDVSKLIERKPRVTAQEVTAYANALLKQKGFNFDFAANDFTKQHALRPTEINDKFNPQRLFKLPFRLFAGRRLTAQSHISDGDPCGYDHLLLPALRVTKQEIWLISGGQQFRIKRPANLFLEEMTLVDRSLRKTIRRWEVPQLNGTNPVAISADGQMLYLPVYFAERDYEALSQRFGEKKQLVSKLYPYSLLAVATAGIHFEVGSTVLANQQAEDLKKFPHDPRDAYLAYRRFRVAGKTYIVRFSWPCT